MRRMKSRLLLDTARTPLSYLFNIKLHIRTVLARNMAVPKLRVPPGWSQGGVPTKTWLHSAQKADPKNPPKNG